MTFDEDDTPVSPEVDLGWPHSREGMPPNCMLIVEYGPDQGREFGPLKEHTTIGQPAWCDIGLTDPSVSNEHCELVWTAVGLRLRALGSASDIRYGEARLRDGVVQPDAWFTVGATTMRLELRDGTQSGQSDILDPTLKLVGASAPMRQLFEAMSKVAPTDVPVLLLGEHGTGKTAIGYALHELSLRKDKPLIWLHCGAENAESAGPRLFGQVRGAFPAIESDIVGVFEKAAGGSVLLEAIDELSTAAQSKLVQVLDTRRVRRVGAASDTAVNFRLFTTAVCDLASDIESGKFPRDLYARIAGMELKLPPLRDRASDIGLLAERMLRQIRRQCWKAGVPCIARSLSSDAIRVLEKQAWPGNLWELKRVIDTSACVAETPTIGAKDVVLTALLADEVPREAWADAPAEDFVTVPANAPRERPRRRGAARALGPRRRGPGR